MNEPLNVQPVHIEDLDPSLAPVVTPYQMAILTALQSKPMYYGTVTAKVKAFRRRLNRRQKASRRSNRG